MNRAQKILGFIAFALFCISVLAAPWRLAYGNVYGSYVDYGPLFNPPTGYPRQISHAPLVTLMGQPLLFTWIAIAIAYASLFFLIRSKRESK